MTLSLDGDEGARQAGRYGEVNPIVGPIMRHNKIAVTMQIYTHIPSDLTRMARRRLGDQLEALK